jgi:hypothetical protein
LGSLKKEKLVVFNEVLLEWWELLEPQVLLGQWEFRELQVLMEWRELLELQVLLFPENNHR